MVLLKTTVAGFAVLVVGILLLTLGGQYLTVEVQEIHRQAVEPHAEFLVGDLADKPYNLPGNSQVVGTVNVNEAPSNQTGNIRLLVFDADNYQKWYSGGQANFAFSAEKQGQFNFTFNAGRGGVYHFVFDNRASLFKKYVTITIAYNEIVTSRVPDTRVGYVGWTLAVIGVLVFLYGILRKPHARWD